MNPAPTLHARTYTLLLAILVFLSVAPTLPWLQFFSGSEDLNVETVLEMRRGGPWLIPTLHGSPRETKPPLTAWASAALLPRHVVDDLAIDIPPARDAAYDNLAWHIRWPALALACLAIVLIGEMGRAVGGPAVGLLSAVVAASNFLFLRYCRSATTDVQLFFWVTATNAILLHAMPIRRRWWPGCLAAGATLGLAFMSKGPVCLVQTIVPIGAWAAWTRWRSPPAEPRPRAAALPIVVGLLVTAAIALPWYAYVLKTSPGIGTAWTREVTRVGATENEPGPWCQYASLFGQMFPWTVPFIAGLIVCCVTAWRGDRRIAAAIALLLVPIVIMSFFKDKPERYLLPMLGPASIVTAEMTRRSIAKITNTTKADWRRSVASVQWVVLLAIVTLPLAGAARWHGAPPWFDAAAARGAVLIGWMLVAFGFLAARRRPAVALPATTIVVMLAAGAFALTGYRTTPGGQSSLRPLAFAARDAMPIAGAAYLRPAWRRAEPNDFSIYLDRTVPQLDAPPPAAKPGEPTQLLLTNERRDQPPPSAPAPGWRTFGIKLDGKQLWHTWLSGQ